MVLCCAFAIFAGCSYEEQKPAQSTDDNSSEGSSQEPINSLQSTDNKPSDTSSQQQFYSLRAAYSAGLLTQEELLSIAYYHHSQKLHDGTLYNATLMGENYAPIAQSQNELSDEQINAINQLWSGVKNDGSDSERYKAEYVRVSDYCGTYNAGIVCSVIYCESEEIAVACVVNEFEVGGVKFCYPYASLYNLVLWTGND